MYDKIEKDRYEATDTDIKRMTLISRYIESEIDREPDGQADRHTDRQTDKLIAMKRMNW